MPERNTNRRSLILAAFAGVVLIALLRNLFAGGGGTEPVSAVVQPEGNQRCISLTVVASSEKADLVEQMAVDYQRAHPRVDGRCVVVRIAAKPSGAAAEALARGWDDVVDGPRPDVWSPAASSWLVILRQRLAQRDAPGLLPESTPSLAQSPLVIAMPRPMAQALGWPDKPIGWSDVFTLARDRAGWARLGHPEWGRFRLGKTNANFSSSGLHATIGAYFAATGRSSDLSEADIADPRVVDFVKGVESAVVHYGDISLTFLDNLLDADDRGAGLAYVSAVTMEEKSLWDYNHGNPKGNPADLGRHSPPRIPLVAVYPKEGTLVHDHPYAVLTAPWVNDAKRQAAAGFLAFIHAGGQQARFQAAAFRTFEGQPSRDLTVANGFVPSEPKTVLAPPAPAVLDRIQRSWTDLRKRARVLLVIDVSGSMGEAVPKSGATKLELAKQAATTALDQLAPDDEVGLWIFSSDLGQGQPYAPLLPVGPLGPRRAELTAKIASLTPQGGTALYATTRAAVKDLRATFDPARINGIILLTDGRNEYPADTDLDGLVRGLASEDEDTNVRVFPIAYGANADQAVLRRIAESSRAAAYDASDPASIDKVFTAVVSNF